MVVQRPERFDTDWLTLREPFDHAARSIELSRRLADRLPARPRLIDLGAGTGSLFRFLAPIIGRRQDWILIDRDGALLDDAFGVYRCVGSAKWLLRHGTERQAARLDTEGALEHAGCAGPSDGAESQ